MKTTKATQHGLTVIEAAIRLVNANLKAARTDADRERLLGQLEVLADRYDAMTGR